MNSLNEINSDHLRKVAARLPFYNQSRWRDRASDLLRKRGVPPNFRDLTEFLQRRAESENNPLFGTLIFNLSKRELERKRKEEPILSFATEYMCGRFGYERRTVCPVCQGNHNLTVCKEFLQMTAVERRMAVLKSKLCFQCLFPGNYKRTCTKSKCEVDSCKRRHHKLRSCICPIRRIKKRTLLRKNLIFVK